MNAYGPQDWPIEANKIVFDHATVDGWYYIVSIDLKLSPDNLDNASKANIYGLTDGAPFGDPGSEFPAVRAEFQAAKEMRFGKQRFSLHVAVQISAS